MIQNESVTTPAMTTVKIKERVVAYFHVDGAVICLVLQLIHYMGDRSAAVNLAALAA